MKFQKSSNNIVAEALSRLPVSDTENGTAFKEEVVSIICACLNQKDFQKATARDPVLPQVMTFISSSWPEDNKLSSELKSYFSVRDQLSVIDGLHFQGEKIVIQSGLRNQVIEVGHKTHQGILRTTSPIKKLYWWPQISMQIKDYVQHCTVCQATDKPAKSSPAPL